MHVLEVSGLKKSFNDHEVLKGVDLQVPQHSVFGFIGENGAGKTTTMKLILGLLAANDGNIYVKGEQVTFGDTKTNQYIGYLSDVPSFYDYMNPIEYLKLCFEVSGKSCKRSTIDQIHELLELVGLKRNEKKRIHAFSRGMKQRLGIAAALLNEPDLLICDEPTSALDPIGRKEILDILSSIKKKTTILFSTHILSDVERICDTIAILHQGVIVKKGTLEDLKNQHARHELTITFTTEKDMQQTFHLLCDKTYQIFQRDHLTLNIQAGDLLLLQRQVMELFLKHHIYPSSMICEQPSLETIFMEVVQ